MNIGHWYKVNRLECGDLLVEACSPVKLIVKLTYTGIAYPIVICICYYRVTRVQIQGTKYCHGLSVIIVEIVFMLNRLRI